MMALSFHSPGPSVEGSDPSVGPPEKALPLAMNGCCIDSGWSLLFRLFRFQIQHDTAVITTRTAATPAAIPTTAPSGSPLPDEDEVDTEDAELESWLVSDVLLDAEAEAESDSSKLEPNVLVTVELEFVSLMTELEVSVVEVAALL